MTTERGRSNSGSEEQNLVTFHMLAGRSGVDGSESRLDNAVIAIDCRIPTRPLLSAALRAVLLSEMVPVTVVKHLQLKHLRRLSGVDRIPRQSELPNPPAPLDG